MPGPPLWARANQQAEMMIEESAGTRPQQRAGGNPEHTADTVGGSLSSGEAQIALTWENTSICQGLRFRYPPAVMDTNTLTPFVMPPDTDLLWVKNNMVEWMAHATRLGKTIGAHFHWTDLVVALEHGGPTPFVSGHLANKH